MSPTFFVKNIDWYCSVLVTLTKKSKDFLRKSWKLQNSCMAKTGRARISVEVQLNWVRWWDVL